MYHISLPFYRLVHTRTSHTLFFSGNKRQTRNIPNMCTLYLDIWILVDRHLYEEKTLQNISTGSTSFGKLFSVRIRRKSFSLNILKEFNIPCTVNYVTLHYVNYVCTIVRLFGNWFEYGEKSSWVELHFHEKHSPQFNQYISMSSTTFGNSSVIQNT